MSNALRSKYRALSFQPPDTWLAASAVHLGDASEEGGRVVLGIEEELRHPSEGLDAFARRKADALREDRLDVEVQRSSKLLVDGRPAWLLHVRYRSERYPLGPIDHVVVLVDRGDPRSWAVLFMQVLTARFEQRLPAWEKLLGGIRFDELAPQVPRIRPHAATFEPPAHWAEEVSYTFRSVGPDAATISVVFEASVGPFGAFVAGRTSELSANNEVLESAPALAVAGRDAARIRTRARGEKAPVEQLLVVVDGGGTGSQRAVFSATAPAGSAALAGAERALLDLVSSVRFGVVEPAPEPRHALAQGASTHNLSLTGKPPTSVHAELMRRGFVPARIPLAASTTRAGQRRFLRTDGHPTASLADPQLASEIVYAHADGGTVRVFPHGNPSAGLGGVDPGSARISVRYTGSRDLGIDAEEAVIGRLGVHPRTIAPDHLPPDGKDAPVRAFRRVRDTWSVLGGGPPIVLPIEDRVGLRITRTVVPAADFELFAARVERYADSFFARRDERDGVIRFFFSASPPVPCSASFVLDLGSHVLSIDPIGEGGSVDRLQRCLRKLLRGESYRVFDDATGEDLTATVERAPSFLVAPTRRPPFRVTSAR